MYAALKRTTDYAAIALDTQSQPSKNMRLFNCIMCRGYTRCPPHYLALLVSVGLSRRTC